LCAWVLAQKKLPGTVNSSSLSILVIALLAIAWVGQWLMQEVSPWIGPYPAMGADYLLVSVFYCTLFVMAKSVFCTRAPFKSAAWSFNP